MFINVFYSVSSPPVYDLLHELAFATWKDARCFYRHKAKTDSEYQHLATHVKYMLLKWNPLLVSASELPLKNVWDFIREDGEMTLESATLTFEPPDTDRVVRLRRCGRSRRKNISGKLPERRKKIIRKHKSYNEQQSRELNTYL